MKGGRGCKCEYDLQLAGNASMEGLTRWRRLPAVWASAAPQPMLEGVTIGSPYCALNYLNCLNCLNYLNLVLHRKQDPLVKRPEVHLAEAGDAHFLHVHPVDRIDRRHRRLVVRDDDEL